MVCMRLNVQKMRDVVRVVQRKQALIKWKENAGIVWDEQCVLFGDVEYLS